MIWRRRSIRNACWALSISAAAASAATVIASGVAFAAGTFSVSGEVAAVGQAAVMPAGQTPTATVGATAITVSWAPSAFHSGKEVPGYIVNRQAPDGTNVVQVCAVAAPTRTCQDSPPAGQQVTYVVITTAAQWRGPASPPSGIVMLPAPTAAAVLAPAAPSSAPTASPTPAPTSAPSPTPTATATPSPTPSAASSSSPSPTPSPSAS